MLKTSTELLPFGHKFTYKKSAWSDQREERLEKRSRHERKILVTRRIPSWALDEAHWVHCTIIALFRIPGQTIGEGGRGQRSMYSFISGLHRPIQSSGQDKQFMYVCTY
jgi:hypothetical protein